MHTPTFVKSKEKEYKVHKNTKKTTPLFLFLIQDGRAELPECICKKKVEWKVVMNIDSPISPLSNVLNLLWGLAFAPTDTLAPRLYFLIMVIV